MKTLKSVIFLMLTSLFIFSCTSNSDNELIDPSELNQTTEKSVSAKTVVEVVKSHLKSDGSFYNQLNPESSMTFDLGFQFSYPVTLSYNNGTKVVVNGIEQLAIVAKDISQTNYIEGINFPFDIDKEGIKETVFNETDFSIMVNSKDTDRDGTPNYQDTDDDGDGASDISEDQDHDGDYTNDDADNDGDPNYLDTDSDNDGQADEDEDNDGDGDFTNDDSDGDGQADYTDTDSDNDGTEDGDDTDDDNDGTNDSDESYNGGNGTDGSYIDPAMLPQTILDYISENYPNASVIEAEIEDNGDYEVYLSNGGELYFE
jgi:hypothetical protein